jgi:hypothetical protein
MRAFGAVLLVIGIICACAFNIYLGIALAILGGILILVGGGGGQPAYVSPAPGAKVGIAVYCPKKHRNWVKVEVPALEDYKDLNSVVNVTVKGTCPFVPLAAPFVRKQGVCGESIDITVAFPHPAQQKPYIVAD